MATLLMTSFNVKMSITYVTGFAKQAFHTSTSLGVNGNTNLYLPVHTL